MKCIKRQEGETMEKKPRLLCLHGWRSNSDITNLQLSNLGLDKQFEITHLHGPFQSKVAENPLMQEMSTNKTFYSWLSLRHESPEQLQEELVASLKKVLMHVLARGRPYDAVYGFSQGALIASLLSCDALRQGLLRSEFKKDYDVAWLLKKDKQGPWKFVINACGSNRKEVWDMCAKKFGVEDLSEPDYLKGFLLLPSVHIIGGQDKHKKKSKAISKLYYKKSKKVFTLEDVGHEIPISVQKNHANLPGDIEEWFNSHRVQEPETMDKTAKTNKLAMKGKSLDGETSHDGPLWKKLTCIVPGSHQ